MPKLTIWDVADEFGNVSVTQAAAASGVERHTFRKWMDAGLIHYRRLPTSNRIMLHAADVDALIRSMGHKAA